MPPSRWKTPSSSKSLLESHRQIIDRPRKACSWLAEPGHGSPALDDSPRRPHRAGHSDVGRKRHRQRSRQPVDPLSKPAPRSSVHRRQLRRDHRNAARNELFGHEKGAFTDARETRPGKFEIASSGTLFLDEIGDLSLAGQAKLLRVLEEKIVVHVGGSKKIHTDVRVIAATNQDLADLVRQKRFREDLYFRLNVVTLVLPPLRERPADIIPLAEFFLREFSRHAHRKVPKLAASARHRLESHPWPGNIRELRNLCERLAYLHPTDKVEAEDLAFVLSPAATAPALDRG